jgi:hypothetical protein
VTTKLLMAPLRNGTVWAKAMLATNARAAAATALVRWVCMATFLQLIEVAPMAIKLIAIGALK